jgi:hypothetical protein
MRKIARLTPASVDTKGPYQSFGLEQILFSISPIIGAHVPVVHAGEMSMSAQGLISIASQNSVKDSLDRLEARR